MRLTSLATKASTRWLKFLKLPIRNIFRRKNSDQSLEKQLRLTRNQREENKRRLIETQHELIALKKQMRGALQIIDEEGKFMWSDPLFELFRSCGVNTSTIGENATELAARYESNPGVQLLLRSIAANAIAGDKEKKDLGFSALDAGFEDIAYKTLSPVVRLIPFSNEERTRYENLLRSRAADDKGAAASLSHAVELWARQLHSPEDIHFILYADININVIDGSSVWLSAMASILTGISNCVIILKQNINSDRIWSNIENADRLITFQPKDLAATTSEINLNTAVRLASLLDHELPGIRRLFVRGLDAAELIHQTSQFHGRSCVYITDFYRIKNGLPQLTDEHKRQLQIATAQSSLVLCQTHLIAQKISQATNLSLQTFLLPPPIPDLPLVAHHEVSDTIKIGYAGKITPDWGITELLDWTAQLRSLGFAIELHISASKFSDKGVLGLQGGFSAEIKKRLQEEAVVYEPMNRLSTIQLMAQMDFVWCFRPPRLEEGALELSTKLVEMVATGSRCLTYPSEINRHVLGNHYPFYIETAADFEARLRTRAELPAATVQQLRRDHGIVGIRDRLKVAIDDGPPPLGDARLCTSGHDFKFLYPFISWLKARGQLVMVDRWEWGEAEDIRRSERLHCWADTIFCEWGLANAVWHSKNRLPNKQVVVRIHAQEVRERARKFGKQIAIENVDAAIFVNSRVRDRAQKLWSWPLHRTRVVPNFVQPNEYTMLKTVDSTTISLGMVGIVPQLKRLDRAIDLLIEARRKGLDATLRIKGHRLEDLAFMHAPSRKHELDYYTRLYRMIDSDPLTATKVQFDPWGHDMGSWYTGVNVIISCSDDESFHFALADGVLAGCFPVVWPWARNHDLYPVDWIVDDVADATERIKNFFSLPEAAREAILCRNREYIVDRFGHDRIYAELTELLGDHESGQNPKPADLADQAPGDHRRYAGSVS